MRKINLLEVLVVTVLLVTVTALQGFGAVSGGRWQNQVYITEIEGLSHGFTATMFKVVNNSIMQAKIEKTDISNIIPPIYSTRRDVGTNFSTPQQAINTVRNSVFGDSQIRQIIANASGYAIEHGVNIVHVSLLYNCKINGKNKQVLLYFNYKVNNSDRIKNIWQIPLPKTSGYLIVNPNPVWIRVTYISRNLDTSLQALSTYNQIKNTMQRDGILGRLEIDEMDTNGNLVKTLVSTQVNNSSFDMPQSGSYIPEEYITRIINTYKSTIQKDDPLYVVVNYVSNPTIATDKKGKAKISVQVIKKEIDGKSISSGRWYMMANLSAFAACMDGYTPYPQGACPDISFHPDWNAFKLYNSSGKLLPGLKLLRKVEYNSPLSTSQACKSNSSLDRSVICVARNRLQYDYEGNVKRACATAKDSVDRENCYAFYKGKKVVTAAAGIRILDTDSPSTDFLVIKIGGSSSDNGASKITATKFTTIYYISYGLGGNYATYLVSEPLTKIPLGRGAYYYAMQKIAEGLITYNSRVGGAGGYRITKTASIHISNATKSQLQTRFRYDVVDPFKTNRIIDVRHDTVNDLPESYYRGWNTPITFVFTNK